MSYSQLLEEIKDEVNHIFLHSGKEGLPYHNLDHTMHVVSRAGEIARHYNLDDRDFFIVVAAAWFHDIGYYTGEPNGHEERGAAMAGDFLQARNVDAAVVQQVKACILATHMPQHPKNLLEEIVCDADLYHFGTDLFPELNKKMRKEVEMRTGQKIGKQQWRSSAVQLLEAHHYHTEYARNLLSSSKAAHLQRIKEKDMPSKKQEQVKEKPLEKFFPVAEEATAKKAKSDRPDRGIETMFRISSNNHQRLSDMADNKANIMITTTSIILSILLSVLLRKLEDNQHLMIPTLLLLTVCVVTLVFSILATRPSLPAGRFTDQDIDDKKVNLLFFGNFYRMSYDDYSKGMGTMMNDRDFLYGSLTRDVYSQGIVLGRKYRLLRTGYNVFMYGIIASVLAFVIAVIVSMN